MKIRVTMKDPDGVGDSIHEAAKASALKVDGLSAEEREDIQERRHGAYTELCSRWFEYGEYLTVEIDTEAGTAVVVPVGE